MSTQPVNHGLIPMLNGDEAPEAESNCRFLTRKSVLAMTFIYYAICLHIGFCVGFLNAFRQQYLELIVLSTGDNSTDVLGLDSRRITFVYSRIVTIFALAALLIRVTRIFHIDWLPSGYYLGIGLAIGIIVNPFEMVTYMTPAGPVKAEESPLLGLIMIKLLQGISCAFLWFGGVRGYLRELAPVTFRPTSHLVSGGLVAFAGLIASHVLSSIVLTLRPLYFIWLPSSFWLFVVLIVFLFCLPASPMTEWVRVDGTELKPLTATLKCINLANMPLYGEARLYGREMDKILYRQTFWHSASSSRVYQLMFSRSNWRPLLLSIVIGLLRGTSGLFVILLYSTTILDQFHTCTITDFALMNLVIFSVGPLGLLVGKQLLAKPYCLRFQLFALSIGLGVGWLALVVIATLLTDVNSVKLQRYATPAFVLTPIPSLLAFILLATIIQHFLLVSHGTLGELTKFNKLNIGLELLAEALTDLFNLIQTAVFPLLLEIGGSFTLLLFAGAHFGMGPLLLWLLPDKPFDVPVNRPPTLVNRLQPVLLH